MNAHCLTLPTIPEQPRCYGRITGLLIEPRLETCVEEVPRTLFAMFEHEGDTCTWRIPHPEIFTVLSTHLVSQVQQRHESREGMVDQVWIGRTDGRWEVWLASTSRTGGRVGCQPVSS